MAIKNLTLDKIRSGKFYVVKPANGNYPDTGILWKSIEDSPSAITFGTSRKKFDFIYEVAPDENYNFVINKPADVSEFPGFSASMQAYSSSVIQFNTNMIEEAEEDGTTYLCFEKDGKYFNVSWLVPETIPEFKSDKNKFLFKPMEVALPKKPVGLLELSLVAQYEDHFKALKRLNSTSNASAIAVYKDGHTKQQSSAPCHGFINELGNNVNHIITYIKTGITGDAERFYTYWLTQVSPYKDLFLVKDVDLITDIKCFVVDVNYPSNLVSSALISSRLFWESKLKLEVFYKLCKRGVDSNLAFVVAQSALHGDDSNTLSFCQTDSWHFTLLPCGMTNKGIINFTLGLPLNKNELFTKNQDFTSPHRVFDLWGGSGTNTLFKSLQNIYKKKDGYKVVYKNVDEALDDAIGIIQELCSDVF